MQNLGVQFWIVVAFFALSFLQWLFRKLREQQVINQKKRELTRQRDEMLRTGRAPTSPLPDRSLRPAAPGPMSAPNPVSSREQQLRELRRAALEAQRRKMQTARVGAPKPPTPSSLPSTPAPPPRTTMRTSQAAEAANRRPSQRKPDQSIDAGRKAARQPEATPARRAVVGKVSTEAAGLVRSSLGADAPPRVSGLEHHAAAPAGATNEAPSSSSIELVPDLIGGTAVSLAEARRAVMLSEVLSSPLALRRTGLPVGYTG